MCVGKKKSADIPGKKFGFITLWSHGFATDLYRGKGITLQMINALL